MLNITKFICLIIFSCAMLAAHSTEARERRIPTKELFEIQFPSEPQVYEPENLFFRKQYMIVSKERNSYAGNGGCKGQQIRHQYTELSLKKVGEGEYAYEKYVRGCMSGEKRFTGRMRLIGRTLIAYPTRDVGSFEALTFNQAGDALIDGMYYRGKHVKKGHPQNNKFLYNAPTRSGETKTHLFINTGYSANITDEEIASIWRLANAKKGGMGESQFGRLVRSLAVGMYMGARDFQAQQRAADAQAARLATLSARREREAARRARGGTPSSGNEASSSSRQLGMAAPNATTESNNRYASAGTAEASADENNSVKPSNSTAKKTVILTARVTCGMNSRSATGSKSGVRWITSPYWAYFDVQPHEVGQAEAEWRKLVRRLEMDLNRDFKEAHGYGGTYFNDRKEPCTANFLGGTTSGQASEHERELRKMRGEARRDFETAPRPEGVTVLFHDTGRRLH